MAFLGISAFSVIAALAAFYSGAEVRTVLERISHERMPVALGSLELSREAERIVTAAPALLAATRRTQYEEVSEQITTEAERLSALLDDLKRRGLPPDTLATIEPRIDGLIQNLRGLDVLVGRRLLLAEQMRERLRQLDLAQAGALRLVTPAIVHMQSKIARWQRSRRDAPDGEERRDSTWQLAEDIAALQPQQTAQIELSTINNNLVAAANAAGPADLDLLELLLQRALEKLGALVQQFDPRLRQRLIERFDDLRGLSEGPESILQVRADELAIIEDGEQLLARNAALSQQLTEAVDRLVAGAGRDVQNANRDVLAVQRGSSAVLIAVVLASLVCSGLIVWLYVQRDLLRRLSALSSSMLAVAGGNLRVPMPLAGQRDEIDEMARALTVFRDTAVEIEDEGLREIGQARQRLVDAIESTSEGFALYDATDRLVLCNTIYKQMLYGDADVDLAPGTPFETVLRHAVENRLIGEAIDDPEGYIQERLAQHRAPGQPVLQHRSDGRWILISERVVSSGGTVAVYSDITDLKRTEQALVAAKAEAEAAREQAEDANRAKSDFLASVSHELRTPMNAIIGFTRVVMRRAKDVLPAQQQANLDKILVSANHLLSLINDVLDLAKIEARRMDVEPQAFALAPLVEECLRTIQPMTTPDVRLIADLAPDLPQLVQDQDKTRQILINLLSNAAKFTEAGTITVSAAVRGDAIELAVADTGPGIPEEAQAKVFEEFGQVQGSNTKHRGTGLGLPISKRLANLLDGDLTLQSAPGVGSTFTLSVPIRYGGRAPVAEPAAERIMEARTPTDVAAAVEHEVGASDRRLVLAIDDDPDTIELLRENLAEIGYQVVGATRGADGLAKARALQPHAITLDIVMPDMDGWQVLHELKVDPATCAIPVLVITVVDQAKLGYRLGAAAYLVKPFERDQLVATLGQIAPRCRRLLVVDDDPNVANLVRQLLEADGYAIEAAADGKLALRVLAERRPDAILLDLKMPEMDGFDVVRKLREDADRCDIPVIVLTAKLLTRMEERHLKEQVSAVMDKATLDQGALVDRLKRILPRAVRDDSNSDAAA